MDERRGVLGAGWAFGPVHSPECVEGVLYRVALVQQPRLWRCLRHYSADQGANLLLCGHHLFRLSLGELCAGYAPGAED
ncbi:hypothetical protein ES703_121942 [subsurface metagenome]